MAKKAEGPDIPSLVEQARTDRQAFAELYDRFFPSIFNYILHRTANAELSRDLAADTFLQVMRKLWTFRFRGIPFSAWLFRVASNQVNQHFRRFRNYRFVSLGKDENTEVAFPGQLRMEIQDVEDQLCRQLDFLKLHAVIATLKPKYQEIVTLRFFEDQRLEDIAEILGKPLGTVKSLLHRAIKQLEEKMGSPLSEENR